jgi:hypothetical protein
LSTPSSSTYLPTTLSSIDRGLLEADIVAAVTSTTPEILKPETICEEAVQDGSVELLLLQKVFCHIQDVPHLFRWEICIPPFAALHISNNGNAASASSFPIVANDVRPSV